jgi:hypothetical protein
MEKTVIPCQTLARIMLVLGFCLFISLPLADRVFHIAPRLNFTPNQRRINCPPLALLKTDINNFIKNFSQYYNNNFGFRDNLGQLNSLVKVKVFNTSPIPKVLVGKHHWLFLVTEREEMDIVQNYRAMIPFTEVQLQQWTQLLEERQTWLEKQGIKYLFVLVPDKMAIYPEYLPKGFSPVGDKTRASQLTAYLKTHSTVPVIYLQTSLLEAKQEHPAYFVTDTHWNSWGAFAGYQEIVQKIGVDFPQIQPLTINDFRLTKSQGETPNDLGRILYFDKYFSEDILNLVPIRPFKAEVEEKKYEPDPSLTTVMITSQNNSDLPTALVMCDSFIRNYTLPYLAENFRHAFFIRSPRNFDANLVKEEKPDIVIQEMVEWHLLSDPPVNTKALTSNMATSSADGQNRPPL